MRGGHISPTPSPGVGTSSTEDIFRNRWRFNLDPLLKLNLVTGVNLSPSVYEAISIGTRKKERNILQSAYNNIAIISIAVTTAPLTITKDFYITIVNLMFWSGDLDCLD